MAAGQGERRVEHAPDPLCARGGAVRRRRDRPRHRAQAEAPEARHHAARRRRGRARRRSSPPSTRGSNSTYSTGKFAYKGKEITLDDAEDILRTIARPGRAEGGLGGLARHRAADAARLRQAGRRSPTKARASWASATPARSGAPGTTCSPTPSPPRSTRCGSRSRRSTTICIAMCAAGSTRNTATPSSRRRARSAPISSATCGRKQWGNIYDVVAPQVRALELRPDRAPPAQQFRRGENGQDRREFLHLARLRAAARDLLAALAAHAARATARWSATPRPGTSTTRTTSASRCARG